MKRIICLVLSLVFTCTAITAFAGEDTFISEYIADSVYETLYTKYSQFSSDDNLLGFYKANSNCDANKASYFAFYNDGTVFATLSTTPLILNFGGTYTANNGRITVTLENSNNYYGISKMISEPLTFDVSSKTTLLYSGRDYEISPLNGEKFELISGIGFDIITVKYNGEEVKFDQAPVIINGRTMVPLRAVMEKMGCTVTWKDSTKTANVKNDDAACALQIGNNLMSVLDKKTNVQTVETLDASPVIINSRLLLPLRAVAEVFGATVNWDDKTRTVSVAYTPDGEETPDTGADTGIGTNPGTDNNDTTNPDDGETPENEELYEPATVYIKQRSKETCTLASVAMMLRKKAELLGKDFVKITELRLKPYAWQEEGLKNSFLFETYAVESYVDSNFSSLLYEDKKEVLIDLLKNHPEGIVVYDYDTPHAIWISSYDSSTGYFYVSDPSSSVPQGIVILEESEIGGETAAEKITAIDKIWYVS